MKYRIMAPEERRVGILIHCVDIVVLLESAHVIVYNSTTILYYWHCYNTSKLVSFQLKGTSLEIID